MAGHVSIHARHCWRARPAAAAASVAAQLFQSTPAIAGGRDDLSDLSTMPRSVFQSTPAIAGGRDFLNTRCHCDPQRFNPRPPLLAGETRFGLATAQHLEVSIHARHCWRARQRQIFFSLGPFCFNPRPPLLAGETTHSVIYMRLV